jgi:hypothetical protein
MYYSYKHTYITYTRNAENHVKDDNLLYLANNAVGICHNARLADGTVRGGALDVGAVSRGGAAQVIRVTGLSTLLEAAWLLAYLRAFVAPSSSIFHLFQIMENSKAEIDAKFKYLKFIFLFYMSSVI